MSGRILCRRIALGALVFSSVLVAAAPAPAATTTRSISSGGTSQLGSGSTAAGLGRPAPFGAAEADAADHQAKVNRRHSNPGAKGPAVSGTGLAGANPELGPSFDGLTALDQVLANNGNQFSVEPPDQGLCAGNGYVMETVNTVMTVTDTAGHRLAAPTDLNSFYGYPAQYDLNTGEPGPFTTDPSCLYDADTQRWFQVILTLALTPAGQFDGPNWLDIAVSKTSSPLGAWTLYHLPVTDDGSDGTPDHHCVQKDVLSYTPSHPNACIGDYPHIGADANGFYVTTNEYPLFDFYGFHAAQVYAFSKRALAAGDRNVAVTQFDTAGMDNGNPGFTLWPASSPAGAASTEARGTEYLLSNNAAAEANGSGVSRDLLVWGITNTASLATRNPAPALSHTTLKVGTYATPSPVTQRTGPTPLVDCLNDRTVTMPYYDGAGCWRLFFNAGPPPKARLAALDALDGRMQQTMYVGGHLWGAAGTALSAGGGSGAGVAWYDVTPSAAGGTVQAGLGGSGYLALPSSSLTMPAIGMVGANRGAIGFTVAGTSQYPSAGYSIVGPKGPGPVHVAKAGLGPADGFTGQAAFDGAGVERWGDYGAAVPVGGDVWLANEYIGNRCTFAQWLQDFSCGGTREILTNWTTRISRVTP